MALIEKPAGAKSATPATDNPNPNRVLNPGNTGPAVLNFDDVETIPGASQRASLTNPFQDKVNELAKSGAATSLVVREDDEDWTRMMIRRAAGAINKGAVTKVAPATKNKDGSGDKIPGHVRIYFSIGEKRARKSS